MGDHPNTVEEALAVVSDVADAAAGSNTRGTLVRRVGEVLSRRLNATRFELGWIEDIRSWRTSTVAFEAGADVRASTRDLSSTETRRILQAGTPACESVGSGLPEVVIPLLHSDGPPGYARISLASAAEGIPDGPLLETLGRILGFAQSHCSVVERIAKQSSVAHHENQDLRQELLRYTEGDRIVARSESMRRVIESADIVARHDTPVLLRGESGTGKELLARRIHRLSKRARQPFVPVNCGALPETLIESELFGHEKGAFTGASTRHRGRFERANNGTIFLDEIAELPAAVQVKLLRVLQEGELERLGAEETIRVNVRILAATHRQLEHMIEEGSFRADLFYRINVFPIVIPALRERQEDIPILARTLLDETAKRLGCRVPSLGAEGMAKLLKGTWPGNVRELANTLERALIMTKGRELELPALPSTGAPALSFVGEPVETYDDAARRAIQKALEACGGRIYGKHGAAARLGMPPSTLQGKMRRLQISLRRRAAP